MSSTRLGLGVESSSGGVWNVPRCKGQRSRPPMVVVNRYYLSTGVDTGVHYFRNPKYKIYALFGIYHQCVKCTKARTGLLSVGGNCRYKPSRCSGYKMSAWSRSFHGSRAWSIYEVRDSSLEWSTSSSPTCWSCRPWQVSKTTKLHTTLTERQNVDIFNCLIAKNVRYNIHNKLHNVISQLPWLTVFASQNTRRSIQNAEQ